MKYFGLLLVILWGQTLSAQTTDTLSLHLNYNQKQAAWVLHQLEQQFQVKFSYPTDLLKNKTVTLQEQYNSLDAVLLDLSLELNLDFQKLDKRYIYVVPSQSKPLKEVWVTGYLGKSILKSDDASFEISSKNWHLLPGLTEPDILEGIQSLPGVVSLDETATQFSVRGGTADQNRIIWDGINIYHGGHLFGLVSVFNPNIPHRITFIDKGTPVTFGERVSSIINIQTSDKIADKSHIELGLNGISADAILKFPVIKNQLDFQASFRRSYEDIFETETFRLYENKAFQNTKIQHEFFMFKDYNFKINYKLNNHNNLHLSMIHIDNDLEHTYRQDNTTLNDLLDTENQGFSINLQSVFKQSKWHNAFSFSGYRLDYMSKTAPDTGNASVFTKNNRIKDVNFLSDYQLKTKRSQSWNFGYQLAYKAVNFVFKERHNNSLFNLDNDDRTLYTNALFVAFHRKNYHNWDFYAGLRANYYLPVKRFKLEPRLIVNRKLNQYLKLQMTGEIKHQVISQINETVLSDLGLERKVWRLVDFDKFPIISAKQVSLGGIFQRKNWLVDFDFYYKYTGGISTLSLGFLNPVDNSFHVGVRSAFGLDLFVRKNINTKLKTWLSYSYMDVKEQYDGLNDGVAFPAHTGISHVLSLSTSYHYKKIELAAAWKIHSGKAFTELETENYADQSISYFESINSDRLPVYHRMDISGVYKFKVSKQIKGKVGISIKNVYNRKSLIHIEYSGNNQPNDPVQIRKYYAIGLIPNFVFRLKW